MSRSATFRSSNKIVAFMQTKTPPVPNAVTLEIFAFMEAAQRSKASNGTLTPLQH